MRPVLSTTMALAVLTVTALADPPEPRPYFYLWDEVQIGGTSGWSSIQDFASQVVRVDINGVVPSPNEPPYIEFESHADYIAYEAASMAWDQIEAGRTDADHISLLLQNFAALDTDHTPSTVSFFNDDEALDPPPSPGWPNTPNHNDKPYKYMQPWMTQGRIDVQNWLIEFIERYKYWADETGFDVPWPARATLDSEIRTTNCCDRDYTYVLWQQADDERWGGENEEPVPGFGGATMEDLFEEAVIYHNWQVETPFDMIRLDRDPNQPENLPYFIWAQYINQAAVDAAMGELYAILKNTTYGFGANNHEIKCSNYFDSKADGKMDTFGWYSGKSPTGSQSTYTHVRDGVRGATSHFSSGAEYRWNDFIEYSQPNGQGSIVRRSQWNTERLNASGDFSAPVLYIPHPAHWPAEDSDFKQYYLKDWPDATQTSATLANGRRWVESILNTPDGHGPDEVFPWVMAVDAQVQYDDVEYTLSTDEFVLTLAQLRAKAIREVGIWWDHRFQQPAWGPMYQLMDWVYVPQVGDAEVVAGDGPDPVDLDALRYTLRENDPADEVVLIESEDVGDYHEVALWVTFDHLQDFNQGLRLNLECAITPDDGGDVDDARGFVYLGEQELDPIEWDQQAGLGAFDDFQLYEGFGFFAPWYLGVVDTAEVKWYETRRTFPINVDYVYGDAIWVKLVLRRDDSEPFTARFDLTQLVGAPAGGDCESFAQGADFDHSQSVSLVDLLAFQGAYAAGRPSADMNRDGQVNVQDMVIFGAKFNGPP